MARNAKATRPPARHTCMACQRGCVVGSSGGWPASRFDSLADTGAARGDGPFTFVSVGGGRTARCVDGAGSPCSHEACGPDEQRKGEAALGARCRLLDCCRSRRGLDSRMGGSSAGAFFSGAGRLCVVEITTSSSSAADAAA